MPACFYTERGAQSSINAPDWQPHCSHVHISSQKSTSTRTHTLGVQYQHSRRSPGMSSRVLLTTANRAVRNLAWIVSILLPNPSYLRTKSLTNQVSIPPSLQNPNVHNGYIDRSRQGFSICTMVWHGHERSQFWLPQTIATRHLPHSFGNSF